MPSVKIEPLFGDIYYPECPYARIGIDDVPCDRLHGQNPVGAPPCAEDGTYYCGTAITAGICPFNLHEELYGKQV